MQPSAPTEPLALSQPASLGSGPWAGRFISFEGIDGAGKSSHIQSLAEWLQGQGADVLLTREPGGTPLAESLRQLVLHQPMDSLSEALLVFAARRDHLRQHILPALRRGQTVLCDRFTDASFAYQGGGHGLPQPVLQTLEAWVQADPAEPSVDDQAPVIIQPDLTLWFDLPADTAARRRAAARSPDRFENQDTAFFERVRAAYAERAAQAPQRFAVIDALGDRAAVWGRVVAAVQLHRATAQVRR